MAITKYDQFDFLIDIVPRCCISISILQDQTRILVIMNLPTQTFCPPGMTSSQPPRGRSQVFGWFQIRSVGKTLRSLLDTSKVSSWKSNICIVQVSYYFQLAQQHQQQLQQNSGSPTQAQQVISVAQIPVLLMF